MPTTLMGRHPGWGEPGGGFVEAERLRSMWKAIRQQGIRFDGILSGYMGHDSHVDLCADIIQEIKLRNNEALTLIDPVMGDNGALYIPASRAQAISQKLIPLADMITPNIWEISYLAKQNFQDINDLILSARGFAPETIITSAPNFEDTAAANNKIGAIWIGQDKAAHVSHERFARVPHGGGDALAATILAHKLSGLSSVGAMERAVGSIFTVMKAANAASPKGQEQSELPLINSQDALINGPQLKSRMIIL